MFTGIISALGTILEITPNSGARDMRVVIGFPGSFVEPSHGGPIAIGASIACSGCCLTAISIGADSFAGDVSAETLSKTTLGGWRPGERINLERPLRIGEEVGGHIVSGHVDGIGETISATPEHGSVRWVFRVPEALARFIAPKGSVAVDGVSLTVNAVTADTFGVNIIPHTAEVTRFGTLTPGDAVNIEVDMLARYVARLGEFR